MFQIGESKKETKHVTLQDCYLCMEYNLKSLSLYNISYPSHIFGPFRMKKKTNTNVLRKTTMAARLWRHESFIVILVWCPHHECSVLMLFLDAAFVAGGQVIVIHNYEMSPVSP